ncbi:MAG: hypothetical protein J5927_00745 [Oscillospiraceae bacterium]|nr:hypothetical protein [Oscillospiraceae bacterium]
MKELSSMTDRELLLELVADKRRADRARRIKAYVWMVVAAALAVLCLIYVPRIVHTVRHYNQVISQVSETVTEAQGFLDSLNAIGTDKLQDTVDQLGETAQKANDFFSALGDGGVEKLQQSLDQMQDISQQAGEFFRTVDGTDIRGLRQSLESISDSLSSLQSFLHIGAGRP